MKTVSRKGDNIVVNGIEWRLFVTRNMSLWQQFSSVYGSYHHTGDFGVNSRSNQLSLTVHGTYTYVFKNGDQEKAYAAAVLEAVSTKSKVDSLKKKYLLLGGSLLNALRRCVARLSPKNWEEFAAEYRRYTAGLPITVIIGRQGSGLLVERLRTLGLGEREREGVISAVTYPDEHTPFFLSRRDMLRIGADIQAGKITHENIRQRLEEWLERYRHIPVNFVDEPWSWGDAESRLGEATQEDCKTALRELERNHRSKIQERDRILKEIADDEVSTLAYAIQEGTYLNEFRKSIFSRVSLECRPVFREVAKRAGLSSWRRCFYLSSDEMTRIIKGEDISADSLIRGREVVGLFIKKGVLTILADDLAQKLWQLVKEGASKQGASIDKQARLKGTVANKGKVRGKARVVLSAKDFPKVGAGDILVTTMTSVDFVPVMERAAAFVTDEGGVTSHAAIVAREMNKPCIIGTKIATQVLRDGDLVEVDADRGIVRKL